MSESLNERLERLEIELSFLAIDIEHWAEVLDELSTKLDNKTFEQMMRKNGLE